MGWGAQRQSNSHASTAEEQTVKSALGKLFHNFEVEFTGPFPIDYEKSVVRVVEDFAAANPEEISLRKGELIECLSQRKARNDGWWTGRRCGHVGLFPESVVEFLPQAKVSRLAISNSFYSATDHSELSFELGELLEIICEPLLEPSVFIGRLRGKEGTVDVNCVEWFNTDSVIEQLREPPEGSSGGFSEPDFASGFNSRDSTTSVELEQLQIQMMGANVESEFFDAFARNSKDGDDQWSDPQSPNPTSKVDGSRALSTERPETVTPGGGFGSGESGNTVGSTASWKKTAMSPSIARGLEIDYDDLDMKEILGRGGFSQVWWAKYQGEDVAVKKLLHSHDYEGRGEQVQDMLIKEAEVNASLLHRNIVRMKGICTIPPNYALVMEFIDNGVLRSHLRDTLEPRVLLDWAHQLAMGMNYLHEEAPVAIIHRDLKSLNVLIAGGQPGGPPAVIKITDFGMARQHHHTTKMSGAGTAAWMSPEVIRSGVFSKGADVWSYGVVLWEMLTGQLPYDGIEAMAVAFGVGRGNLTLPIPEDCPKPFDTLMTQCWMPEPKDRPTFRNIIDRFRAPDARRFSILQRNSLVDTQMQWEKQLPIDLMSKISEITAKSNFLDEQAKGLESKEEELSRLAASHYAQQAALKQKEKELREKEATLSMREVMLTQTSDSSLNTSDSARTRRKSFSLNKRLWRRGTTAASGPGGVEISLPLNFQHIAHIGDRSEVSMMHAGLGVKAIDRPLSTASTRDAPMPPPPEFGIVPPPGQFDSGDTSL